MLAEGEMTGALGLELMIMRHRRFDCFQRLGTTALCNRRVG